MSLEKVFDRKKVKEEAGRISLKLGEMQGMFHDYGIRVFNTETNELEIATLHTATTADLLSVIKYYEDKIGEETKDLQELVKQRKEELFAISEKLKAQTKPFEYIMIQWRYIEQSLIDFFGFGQHKVESNSSTQLIEENRPTAFALLVDRWENEEISAVELAHEALQLGKRQNKIAGIIWEKRYSITEADDKFGRWMRIGRINDMTVAIITKVESVGKIKFVVKLPNIKGDETLQNNLLVDSEDEAMIEAGEYIRGYADNFRKMEVNN